MRTPASKSKLRSTVPQPTIARYVQSQRSGIQAHVLSRNAIGYIVRGKKFIYEGDQRREVGKGDIFYLNQGCHYLEEVPDGPNKPFEQIVFFYDSDDLNRVLNNLSVAFRMHINNNHECDNCRDHANVIYPGWDTIRHFFSCVGLYLKENFFTENPTGEALKMTELVFLILSNDECCLKSKILKDIDAGKATFEQIIQKHIFEDIPIEELALKCNRSLTVFKKEFRRHFFESPHKWFVRQRLMHSRLLLISTNKPVSVIGRECRFSNTSHFIKLFKQEFGMTPIQYRNEHFRKPVRKRKTAVV